MLQLHSSVAVITGTRPRLMHMVRKGEKEEMGTMTMITGLHINTGVPTHIMAEIRQTRGIYLHMLQSILCFCHHDVTAL